VAVDPAPIAGLYVLEQEEIAELSIERLGFARALGTITEHGFHLADEPESITRQAFERASALAAAAPVWRLSTPVGLDELAATRTMLARLDHGENGGGDSA
jgi:hypothetical protein